MRHSGRALTAMAVSLLLHAAYARAGDAPKSPPVKSITRLPEEFGDLSRVLSIQKAVATCQLTNKASRLRLRIDFYQKGKKLEKESQRSGIEVLEGESMVKCAVHLIDLDYLPLGGGEPGHLRVHFQLGARGISFGTSSDIAKSDFHGGAINVFSARAAKGNEIPLFYAIANTNSIVAGATPEDVIRVNPDADVLVATLEVE